jgi:alkyl sulfatase BDS1-like metallo-beta-lactamase superfamily hydrolase
VTFTDLDRSWSLHVRRGVAEVSDVVPDEVDVAVSLPRLAWAEIVMRQKTLAQVVQAGEATIAGDIGALREILGSLDQVSTVRPDPEDLH